MNIKYLRKNGVPYGCMIRVFNYKNQSFEYGWSLCSKEDKFSKKLAVQIAKSNLNVLIPPSIINDLEKFEQGFFRAAKVKLIRWEMYLKNYDVLADYIKMHQINIKFNLNNVEIGKVNFTDNKIINIHNLQMFSEFSDKMTFEFKVDKWKNKDEYF